MESLPEPVALINAQTPLWKKPARIRTVCQIAFAPYEYDRLAPGLPRVIKLSCDNLGHDIRLPLVIDVPSIFVNNECVNSKVKNKLVFADALVFFATTNNFARGMVGAKFSSGFADTCKCHREDIRNVQPKVCFTPHLV